MLEKPTSERGLRRVPAEGEDQLPCLRETLRAIQNTQVHAHVVELETELTGRDQKQKLPREREQLHRARAQDTYDPQPRDEHRRILGGMGISSDITELNEVEAKLRESEERFRVAWETSLDALTLLTAVRDERGEIMDFRWAYVNPVAGRLLRRPPEELVGQRLLEVLPGNKNESDLFDRYVRVVETGQPHDYEVSYKSDGIRGWFRNMAVKLGDGIAIHFSDITERKHVEAERARIHEDLLSILNALRQGIIMTDPNGRITFVSNNCLRFLGRKAESIYGSDWIELYRFEQKDKAALEEMSRRAPDQRSTTHVRLRNAQGHRFSMEVDLLDDPQDSDRKIISIYDVTEADDLRRLLDEKCGFYGLVGQSQCMQTVYAQIHDLADVDVTVLIEGETGTGKELVARGIHAASSRSSEAFVAVNCAGLTESLIGSQLFGHKRGAFTGAIADHHGVFETASGGTVLLDEIGDLPLAMQTSLLRVLQEKEVTRVGESTPRRVDVRVIAATNRRLDQLVAEGKFRQDLLYRIRVARIVIPPLRERREDIPLLVETFLSRVAPGNHKPVLSVSDEAMRQMLRHDWPGNVRELQSAVESACIGCQGSVVQAGNLPPELNADSAPGCSVTGLEEDTGARLLAAIRAARGSRTKAASLLGVSRATFYRRLRELHLDTESLP